MDEQGIEDAAILLMSLGEEEAAEVFKHLEPKEVQSLGETIAKLKLPAEMTNAEVHQRICKQLNTEGINDVPSLSVIKRIRSKKSMN